jgi:hypothetical protein
MYSPPRLDHQQELLVRVDLAVPEVHCLSRYIGVRKDRIEDMCTLAKKVTPSFIILYVYVVR